MTNPKLKRHYDIEALRGLVAFCAMIFIFFACVDVGHYNAKKYRLQSDLAVAAATGVEGLPNPHLARKLVLNVANSSGIPLQPYDVTIDPNCQWVQIDMKDSYTPIFLDHIGIRQIPINVHVFDF